MPTCELCREERELCDSHVIPEFFYRPGYDEKGRAIKLDRRSASEPLVQSGMKEPLLCVECEQFLNDSYERDFHRFWYEGGRPDVVSGEGITLNDYDYSLFKLHHLSVLWRASVADQFGHVELGPHEEPIREMILNQKPGDWTEYPFLGVMLVLPGDADGVDEGEVADGTVMEPARTGNWNAHTQYQVVFGGVLWMFFVSSHTDGMSQLEDMLITPDPPMAFLTKPYNEPPVLRELLEDHIEKRKARGQSLRDWP